MSDEEIVSSIIHHEKTDLFEVLHDRYSDKVFRKCLSFVRDQEMAQDMVQDVFLKVYTQLSKFKGNSRFSTWLYAITYNYCVEHYRKNNRIKTVDIQEGPDYSDSDDLEETELLSERTHQLRKAMDRIPSDEKMILLSKYQEGVSIKELMNQLGISESAVKMRLSRARKRIKQLIDEAEQMDLVYS